MHAVPQAAARPEKVMTDLKAWSSRRLVQNGQAPPGAQVWARHGSTRHLHDDDAVRRAREYVEEGQDRLPEE